MTFNVDLCTFNSAHVAVVDYRKDATMEQIRDWEKSEKYTLIRIYVGDDMIVLRPQSGSYGIYLGKEID